MPESKDLQETLERESYCSKGVDELIAKFSGVILFTSVDMDKGYWQIELHSDSGKCT